MSRRWGVHCDDCQVDNIQNFNANVPELIVNHIWAFLEVYDVVGEVGELNLHGNYGAGDDDVTFLEFLKEHQQHRLSLVDEYGHVDKILKYAGQMAT
jgi:hypothetical protein